VPWIQALPSALVAPTANLHLIKAIYVMAPRTKVEKRMDADEGVKYTEQEFLDYYGKKKGQKKWDAAGSAAPASTGKVEKRKDADDGKKYTEQEFVDHYGKKAGQKKWNAAAPGAAPKAKAKAKAEPKAKAKVKAKAKPKAASKPRKNLKVCVCGGAGGIGQPLSLLMAQDPNVSELCVFDLNIAMVPPEGVAADLGHIDANCSVKGYVMEVGKNPVDYLEECLTGCNLVLVPAGLPRKPGQTRDDLFKANAGIAKGIVEACGKFCPDAILALIVNPVNSIVPAMAELYAKKGLNPLNVVGVTTLDCVRANKFVGMAQGKNPRYINVPVIGGHAGTTILPLFSQDKTAAGIDAAKIPDMDKEVQDAGTVVVNAKGGKGSATLSMAYAGARFGSCILAGLQGRRRVACAYVKSDLTDLPYFASKVVFGEKGVVKSLPLGDLSEHETKRLEEVKAALKTEIDTGLAYAKENDLACPERKKDDDTEKKE
jgi:malate dehydrogenase